MNNMKMNIKVEVADDVIQREDGRYIVPEVERLLSTLKDTNIESLMGPLPKCDPLTPEEKEQM